MVRLVMRGQNQIFIKTQKAEFYFGFLLSTFLLRYFCLILSKSTFFRFETTPLLSKWENMAEKWVCVELKERGASKDPPTIPTSFGNIFGLVNFRPYVLFRHMSFSAFRTRISLFLTKHKIRPFRQFAFLAFSFSL